MLTLFQENTILETNILTQGMLEDGGPSPKVGYVFSFPGPGSNKTPMV